MPNHKPYFLPKTEEFPQNMSKSSYLVEFFGVECARIFTIGQATMCLPTESSI